jgi:hypothetical protein
MKKIIEKSYFSILGESLQKTYLGGSKCFLRYGQNTGFFDDLLVFKAFLFFAHNIKKLDF